MREVSRNLDGSFFIRETEVPKKMEQHRIYFGPLSTSLKELFASGFELHCSGFARNRITSDRAVKVVLVKGEHRYVVGKTTPNNDLANGVVSLFNFFQLRRPRFIGESVPTFTCEAKVVYKDPPKPMMVRNRTLLEHFQDL